MNKMLLKHIDTIKANLVSIPIKKGQLIFCSDTFESFYDDSASTRIKISDVIYLDTEATRTGLIAPLTNKLYFITATNRIYTYNSGWQELITDIPNASISINKIDSVFLSALLSLSYIKTYSYTCIPGKNIKTFTIILSQYDSTVDTLKVYKNGTRLFLTSGYTLSGLTVTLVTAPIATDSYVFEVDKLVKK